jgi:hypothetical protein
MPFHITGKVNGGYIGEFPWMEIEIQKAIFAQGQV